MATTLLGEFHDRFWLSRKAHGEAAAGAAAALAGLSETPGKRSVAAHLYTVRATQRVIDQVVSTVQLHAIGGGSSQNDLKHELSCAVGAALHGEYCALLDDVAETHRLVCLQRAAQQAPAAAVAPATAGKDGAFATFPAGKLEQLKASHDAERRRLEREIADLRSQVSLMREQLKR